MISSHLKIVSLLSCGPKFPTARLDAQPALATHHAYSGCHAFALLQTILLTSLLQLGHSNLIIQAQMTNLGFSGESVVGSPPTSAESQVQEDSTRCWVAKSECTAATGATCPGVCALQQEESHCNEQPTRHRRQEPPLTATRENPCAATETQYSRN